VRSGGGRIGRILADEVRQLNAKQRMAVLHPASAALRAGPGSGKTRTLVTKIGYLLNSVVPVHQGVAAITYTNQAAQEISRRLSRLGIEPGRRLSTGTVHSWCLNSILRPYAAIGDVPLAEPLTICSEDHAIELTDECLSRAGVQYWKAEFEVPILTSIRRALSAGESTGGYEPSKIIAARLYDARLVELALIDYEAMVSRALQVVQGNAAVRDLIAARYPWLVVDEYQDLGPVLHRLITVLHDAADVNVFCVGDPDQTVMGFTGADPRYLDELAGRADFLTVDLELNYRCGSAIIAAAAAVLGEARAYRADPSRNDVGVVDPIAVQGGLDYHAGVVVETIKSSLAAGVPGHDIAVLYPSKGELLNELLETLDRHNISYLHERDQKLPTGSIVDFVRSCATRSLAGPQSCGWPDIRTAGDVPTLPELVDLYLRLRKGSGLRELGLFEAAGRVQQVVDGRSGEELGLSTEGWITQIARMLELDEIANTSEDERDRDVIAKLRFRVQSGLLQLEDLASGIVYGKVRAVSNGECISSFD